MKYSEKLAQTTSNSKSLGSICPIAEIYLERLSSGFELIEFSAARLDSQRTLVDVIDRNGKVSYRLEGEPNDFSLGLPIVNYEFIDLFRDDKNPQTLDTMKFQMFGWTLIAILIYGYLFLSSISASMTELPTVPESIVVLTGLSQGGYLAGKAVSNMNKPSS